MGLVFLNYARANVFDAKRLHRDLLGYRLDVWADFQRLKPGELWESEIRNAIDHTEIFISLISRVWLRGTGYARQELSMAMTRAKNPDQTVFFIPVRLEPVDLSETVFKDLHWADLFPDWGDGVEAVLRAIQRYRPLPLPPPPTGIHLDPSAIILNVTPLSNLSRLLANTNGDEESEDPET